VDEIVNLIRVIGENLKDKTIFQKVLRLFPMRYDEKVSTVEYRENIDKLTMDEFHGILIAYEMGIEQDNPSKREKNFISSKKKMNHEHMPNKKIHIY
jgi:hypothetical protein